MKKILFFMVALFATMSIFAQTVTSSNIFENTYVSVGAGGYGWVKPTNNGYDTFIESVRPSASIRVGKFLTPTFGFELDAFVGMANRDKFVENSNLSLNGLFNVTNMFSKYDGSPKTFEVVPFVGLGWLRTYGTVTNNLSGKGGVQFNWNLGKDEAWQINLIPSITYSLTNNGYGELSELKFNANRAFVNLQAGVTYKFKNKKGTHNFVLCPYSVTQDEKDAELNSQISSSNRYCPSCHRTLVYYKNGSLIDKWVLKGTEKRTETVFDSAYSIGGHGTVNRSLVSTEDSPRGNLFRIAVPPLAACVFRWKAECASEDTKS